MAQNKKTYQQSLAEQYLVVSISGMILNANLGIIIYRIYTGCFK